MCVIVLREERVVVVGGVGFRFVDVCACVCTPERARGNGGCS